MPIRLSQGGTLGRLGLFVVLAIFILLFGFGSTSASGGLVSAPWDKIVHFCVFATLVVGLRVTMPGLSALTIGALALCIGLADELHQYFVPDRQPELDDWLADLAGTLCGLLVWRKLARLPFFGEQCRP